MVVPASPPSTAEQIRRSFAHAWGEIGAAWGVAPSTAMVQGYLLAHGGPLTEPEVRRALGMSHRAASLALAQCEEWGLVTRADLPRRSGQRGPAALAWQVVGGHWEWFRRVAAARKQRETDPVLPLIRDMVERARTAADGGSVDQHARADGNARLEAAALAERLAGLLAFVEHFDRGVEVFVQGQARAIEELFTAIAGLDRETAERLWQLIGELGPDDLRRALEALAKLPPPATRRLIELADAPVLRRLLGLG